MTSQHRGARSILIANQDLGRMYSLPDAPALKSRGFYFVIAFSSPHVTRLTAIVLSSAAAASRAASLASSSVA